MTLAFMMAESNRLPLKFRKPALVFIGLSYSLITARSQFATSQSVRK